MRDRRAGFTLVDTVILLAVLAIGLRLALPVLEERRLRATSAELVTSLRTLETATRAWAEATPDTLEARAAEGEAPDELARRLAGAVPFRTDDYSIAWRVQRLGGASDRVLAGSRAAIVTVRIPHPALREAFQSLAYPSVWLRHGDTFAFLVAGL